MHKRLTKTSTTGRSLALACVVLLLASACSTDATDQAVDDTDAPAPTAPAEPFREATDDEPTADAQGACDDEAVIMTSPDGVDFVRTPDACFDDLPDWPYQPQYVEIDGLRQAYVDEGPTDGPTVLLLHGQPSWSYLYRHMIPVLRDAGYRVIAMDHLGMGRSDKPTDVHDYSYLGHNDRLAAFINTLKLTDIHLFVQDWGSLIGLRVAGLNPDRFATIAVGDGNLPVIPEGTQPVPPVENPDELADLTFPFGDIPDQQPPFYDGCEPIPALGDGDFEPWMRYALTAESFRASEVIEALTWYDISPEEEAAYDAPFPSRIYMGGPRTFPSLINQLPGQNAEAWAGLTSFEKPFLTLWAANDPGGLGRCETQQNLIDSVPGAEGQPHDRLAEASHFLQDDQGEQIANRLVDWYATLDSPSDGGSVIGQSNPALPAELLQSGYDGPFFMVNLIEFRDRAVYADGRETDLTGVEANEIYGQTGVQVLIQGGMRPAFTGRVATDPTSTTSSSWDQVAIARYPSYEEFFALSQSPDLQAGLEHKDAGVATTTVMPTLRVVDAPLAAELPPAEDPVVLFEILSHDGSGVSDRPEALVDYLDGLAASASDHGAVALGTYEVQGVLIGDDPEWDEVHVWWFADSAELESLLADPEVAALATARDDSLADHDRLILDGVQIEPLGRQP